MAEGAVSFLLEQLSVLLRDERNLLGGLKHEVQSINDELVQLREFLRVADGKEETDSNIKEWIGLLREISYDVEDVLDEYMLRFGPRRATNGFRGSLKKARDSIKNLIRGHQIASEIKTINKRLESVAKSQQKYRDMYAIVNQGSSSTILQSDVHNGRGNALLLQDDEVVGIEKSMEQLIAWIQSKDSGLEVISVVGTGGLGKTTLVKKVYDDISVKRKFDRHVWVTVSDYKEDVKYIMVNLIKKLVEETKESPPQGFQDMSIDDMRSFIYEFLKDNKYIIVLDDVWKLNTWEVIRFALPRKGAHGCIIVTTRYSNIGDVVCSETEHVYNLKPLSEEESEVLFLQKAFPKNTTCPPELRELADKILKKCEGLPLAIEMIGRVLATKKQRKEWELLNRSLNPGSKGNNLGRLWESVFSLSYNDLPYYLKYCFSYLSIFPEGGFLGKGRILKLWIAEGFVQPENYKILDEVAEEYLNELMSRNLIQVTRRYGDGTPRSFRIHDWLREYITSNSSGHNIVTVFNGVKKQWPNKIRRLVIQNSINFYVEKTTNHFKHLRSLILSNGGLEIGKMKEILKKCRLLKVLDLRGSPIESIPEEVFKLYHLKHLCLMDTMVKLIPRSIKYLENLEMLNLLDTNVTKLPSEILELRNLQHLMVCKYGDDNYKSTNKLSFDIVQSFRAPYGIGSCLRYLQTLYFIDADEGVNIKIVREIGMLTQLRRLSIAKVRSEDGKDLCSSISNLTNLRVLEINSIEEGEKLELDYYLSSTALPFLTTLTLHGYLEKLPQWIPSLQALSNLFIWWCKLRDDPLSFLQNLPNLRHLQIHDACVKGLSFNADGFPKLIRLELCELKTMEWVVVEKGSLPFLQDWTIVGCKLLRDVPQGVEHLTNLQDLNFFDMPNEYMERVVEEKRTDLTNWRLARVSKVTFSTFTDRNWSSVAL